MTDSRLDGPSLNTENDLVSTIKSAMAMAETERRREAALKGWERRRALAKSEPSRGRHRASRSRLAECDYTGGPC
jgi:hypothetical protein